MSQALTREHILHAPDLTIERVECPEWGGYVLVKGLNAREWDAYESGNYKIKGKAVEVTKDNVRAKLCVRAICDEQGVPLFTQADVEAMGAKSVAPIERIFEAAMRLSGKRQEDVEAAEKNSEPGQTDASTSA